MRSHWPARSLAVLAATASAVVGPALAWSQDRGPTVPGTRIAQAVATTPTVVWVVGDLCDDDNAVLDW